LRRVVFAAILAGLGLASFADPVASRFQFLLGSVSFRISDDHVRLRSGPGVDQQILRVLDRGVPVVPTDVSDFPDRNLEGGFYWYKCTPTGVADVSGWVYGAFLECRVQTSARMVWVVDPIRIDGSSVDFQANYMFSNGLYKGVDPKSDMRDWLGNEEKMLSFRAGHDGPIRGQLVVKELTNEGFRAEIISGVLPAEMVSALKPEKPEEDRVHYYATMTSRIAFASLLEPKEIDNAIATEPLTRIRTYVASLFSGLVGHGIAFRDVRNDGDGLMQIPLKGDDGRSLCYYYHFIGVVENKTLMYHCFLVLHSDGSISRTNDEVATYEQDYTKTEAHANTQMPPGFRFVNLVADSPDIGAGLIDVVNQSSWEGHAHSLYVTNGYIVFPLFRHW
jgi:hypothetical protein